MFTSTSTSNSTSSTMGKTCTICGSDWIFKAPKGLHHLCEDCYQKMSKDVLDYHSIQSAAHKNVLAGNVDAAIRLLHLVKERRNQINKYFQNSLNAGHYRFANEFIPALIVKLATATHPSALWDSEFAALNSCCA